MNGCSQHYEENIDVEQEWDNTKNMLWKTAEESLGKIKVTRNQEIIKDLGY